MRYLLGGGINAQRTPGRYSLLKKRVTLTAYSVEALQHELWYAKINLINYPQCSTLYQVCNSLVYLYGNTPKFLKNLVRAPEIQQSSAISRSERAYQMEITRAHKAHTRAGVVFKAHPRSSTGYHLFFVLIVPRCHPKPLSVETPFQTLSDVEAVLTGAVRTWCLDT